MSRGLGDVYKRQILALAEDGTLRLIQANPDRFVLMDEREVAAATTWGHLAMAGDQLFVRELEALSVFRFAPSSEGAVVARGPGGTDRGLSSMLPLRVNGETDR